MNTQKRIKDTNELVELILQRKKIAKHQQQMQRIYDAFEKVKVSFDKVKRDIINIVLGKKIEADPEPDEFYGKNRFIQLVKYQRSPESTNLVKKIISDPMPNILEQIPVSNYKEVKYKNE